MDFPLWCPFIGAWIQKEMFQAFLSVTDYRNVKIYIIVKFVREFKQGFVWVLVRESSCTTL